MDSAKSSVPPNALPGSFVQNGNFPSHTDLGAWEESMDDDLRLGCHEATLTTVRITPSCRYTTTDIIAICRAWSPQEFITTEQRIVSGLGLLCSGDIEN